MIIHQEPHPQSPHFADVTASLTAALCVSLSLCSGPSLWSQDAGRIHIHCWAAHSEPAGAFGCPIRWRDVHAQESLGVWGMGGLWAPVHCRRVGVFSNGTAAERRLEQADEPNPASPAPSLLSQPPACAGFTQLKGTRSPFERGRTRASLGDSAEACCYICWHTDSKDSMTFYSADTLLSSTYKQQCCGIIKNNICTCPLIIT